MIIPRLLTGHSAVYPLVAAFALTLVFIACGGGSASDPFATAAPANMPTNTIIPTNSISAPTPVATQTVQPLATVRAATVLEPTLTPAPDNEDTVTAAGGFSMGGAALGGSAETTLLAQETLVEVPDGPVAWVAHEFTLAYGQSIEHVHEFAFVYAVEGPHQLLGRQDEHNLTSGEGAVVLAGAPHRHAAQARRRADEALLLGAGYVRVRGPGRARAGRAPRRAPHRAGFGAQDGVRRIHQGVVGAMDGAPGRRAGIGPRRSAAGGVRHGQHRGSQAGPENRQHR